jgi:hypothetical protein
VRILVIANSYHILRGEQFDAKTPGLLYNAFSKIRAGHPLRKAWVIIQAFSNTGLAAQPAALDDQHIKTIASGINSGSKRCWTATDNDEVIKLAFCFGL